MNETKSRKQWTILFIE
ncbi:hypothetical protein ACJIZ3_008059 [Penstemon smallii]|uniref:Uncharacterized protein n=1 Tax=Penstemon smallii TaxID=265156 RepID=A0ABD3TA68_9LAMI